MTAPSLGARARAGVRRLARRLPNVWRGPEEAPVTAAPPTLDAVRRRLELLLAALYGRPLRVEPAPDPPRRSWLLRLLGEQAPPPPLATHEGDVVRLPRILDADVDDALVRWRLLALGQAERIARGSAARAAALEDRMERALFAVREGSAVDRTLARRARSVRPTLEAARAWALASRAPLELSPAAERDVERLLRAALAPAALDDPAEGDADADASLAWARETAARLRETHGRSFRAIAAVRHWGLMPETDAQALAQARDAVAGLVSMPGVQQEGVSRDPRRGARTLRLEDARSRATPPAPRVDEAGHVVIAVETPPGAGVPGAAPEPPADADGAAPSAVVLLAPPGAATASYPEWDARTGRHRAHGVTVIVEPAPEGDAAWSDAVLRDHAALVRRVRHRFEPLRARRARQARQRHGDEIDLAACVESVADRAAGQPDDGRLYVAVRPARRALAIALLVDVSGSTDARVSDARDDTRQIIDVEKEAVLLAGEALDALGDPFAVLTFSSRGAHAVRVHTIKAFGERHDAAVRRRVSAIRPAGNTRLGAAVRHASALLARQPAGHRLLLLLSDGRPNDMDGYQGRYAVEDARQAVHEARALGIFPFCLTVDREESEYLPHIFGAAGHTVLRRPDQLPVALVRAVRQLLGAGAR